MLYKNCMSMLHDMQVAFITFPHENAVVVIKSYFVSRACKMVSTYVSFPGYAEDSSIGSWYFFTFCTFVCYQGQFRNRKDIWRGKFPLNAYFKERIEWCPFRINPDLKYDRPQPLEKYSDSFAFLWFRWGKMVNCPHHSSPFKVHKSWLLVAHVTQASSNIH